MKTMKNYFIFFASLCTMALVSCASDDNVEPTPTGETFQASIDVKAGSAETRMTHNDADTQTDATFAWDTSDHLGLLSPSLATQNTDLTSQGSGTYTGFHGTATFDGSKTGTQTFYAYYPYNSNATISVTASDAGMSAATVAGLSLPNDQGDGKSWAKNSFAYSNAMTGTVANGESTTLNGSMTHMFAYLKFAFRCEEKAAGSTEVGSEFAKGADGSSWKVASVTLLDAKATTVGTPVNTLAGTYTADIKNNTCTFTGDQSSSIKLTSDAFTGDEIIKTYDGSIHSINSENISGTGSMMVVPASGGSFNLWDKAVIIVLNKLDKSRNVVSRCSRTRLLNELITTEADAKVAAGDVLTLKINLKDELSGPLWEDESGLISNIVYTKETPVAPYVNLAAGGSANCYIVPIPSSRSNAGDGYAYYYIPVKDGLGKDVAAGEYIEFRLDLTKTGNAVIAYPDNTPSSTSPKLWSWHIWAPATQPGTEDIVTYESKTKSKVYTLMNMDLGAMNHYEDNNEAATSEKHTLYQWGRKDPFSNLKTVYMYGVERTVGDDTNGRDDTSVTWPRVEASTNTGSIKYAYENPEIFLAQPSADDSTGYKDVSTHYKWDWLFGVDHSVAATNDADNRWGNPYTGTSYSGQYGGNHNSTYTKTNYDPCPYGYKVPPMDTWNRLLTTGNRQVVTYGVIVNEVTEGSYTTTKAFYPFAGYRNPKYASMGDQHTSTISSAKTQGNWWSSSRATTASGDAYNNASGLFIQTTGTKITPMNPNSRCDGRMIRCIKDPNVK
jgi:uncharacterized protein (TIGR02145 family)